jgi:spore germination protein
MITVRRRAALTLASTLVLITVATLFVVQQVWPAVLPWNRTPTTVAAYLPEWDGPSTSSFDTAVQHRLSEVSPVWATVEPDGALALPDPPQAEVDALHRRGLRLLPTVQNYSDDKWQGAMVGRVLSDPATAARHVQAVVSAAVAGGWGGVDIDYEALPPTTGPAFTSFLTSLRDQLHAHRLMLSVTVPARTADQPDPDALAYPYELLGTIADEVRVMAYDYSSASSDPGPVAPLPWVEAVVKYAVDRVPKNKLMLGLAGYGYDWTAGRSEDLGAQDAMQLARDYDVGTHWDSQAASAFFSYEEDGQVHVVWYEDSRSFLAKQDVAIAHGLRGVFLWRLGNEDPGVWNSASAPAGGNG